MRGLLKFAWLPVLALPLAAAPFSVSTGAAAWTVTQTVNSGSGISNNGAALNTTTNAVNLTGTLAQSVGLGSNAWLTPSGGPAWVGQQATDGNFISGGSCNSAAATSTCGANPGVYVYTLSFAPGAGGGSFSFGFASDNVITSLTVIQNGNTIYTFGPGTAPMQNAYTNTGNLNFGSTGNVVITATVRNDPFAVGDTSRNPSGFIASGSGETIDGVPEPSTYAMLTLGGMALVAARLRRK